MDKKQVKVTMTLKDYEELDGYKKYCQSLIEKIKKFAVVNDSGEITKFNDEEIHNLIEELVYDV